MQNNQSASYCGSLATSDSFPSWSSPGSVARSGYDTARSLEVAEAYGHVVCAVHLGLMQGALAELRAPLTADSLEPFVEPSLCIASLGDLPPATRRDG
jgi:hypothetical protein